MENKRWIVLFYNNPTNIRYTVLAEDAAEALFKARYQCNIEAPGSTYISTRLDRRVANKPVNLNRRVT